MKSLLNIIMGLIPALGGLLLIIFPEKAVMLSFVVLSVFLLYSGVKNLYWTIRIKELPSRLKTVGIVKNVLSLLVGIGMLSFTLSHPSSAMNAVMYVLASYLLVTAVIDIIDNRAMTKLGFSAGAGMDGLLSIVFSLLMFSFPRLIGSTFLTIIGIILILVGCVTGSISIMHYRAYRAMRKAEKDSKDRVIDVEWEEK